MSQSIKQRMAGLMSRADAVQLRKLMDAILVDLAALRVTVAALQVDTANRLANHNTLIAKLNLDGGVTDVNYAAATAATAAAPDALTLIS